MLAAARVPLVPVAPTARGFDAPSIRAGSLSDPRGLLAAVHARLCPVYGCPIPHHGDREPLEELIRSLLSHRTRNAASGAAFRALTEALPTWEGVRDEPVTRVQLLIVGVTWPEQKAPRIQAVLRAVTDRAGALSLDHLAGMDVQKARAWLEALPGVGPKTSAATLSFSRLRRAALPVDSHHHRVAARLGLIAADLPVGPSHAALAALLPADWDAQAYYDHHQVMMRHGQHRCHFRAPDCAGCEVLDLCPSGGGGPAMLVSDGRPSPASPSGAVRIDRRAGPRPPA